MQTFATLEQQHITLREMSTRQLQKQLNTVLPKYQRHSQKQVYKLSLATKERLRNNHFFSPPLIPTLLSGVLHLGCMREQTQNWNMQL